MLRSCRGRGSDLWQVRLRVLDQPGSAASCSGGVGVPSSGSWRKTATREAPRAFAGGVTKEATGSWPGATAVRSELGSRSARSPSRRVGSARTWHRIRGVPTEIGHAAGHPGRAGPTRGGAVGHPPERDGRRSKASVTSTGRCGGDEIIFSFAFSCTFQSLCGSVILVRKAHDL